MSNIFDQFGFEEDEDQPAETQNQDGNIFDQFDDAEPTENVFDQFGYADPEPEPEVEPEPEPTFWEDMKSAFSAGTAGLAQSAAELARQSHLRQYAPANYLTEEQRMQIFEDTGTSAYSLSTNYDLIESYLTEEQKAQRAADIASDWDIKYKEEQSRMLGEEVAERTPRAVIEDPWSARGIAGTVVTSGTRMAPGLALSVLTGNPVPAMAAVGLDVYGSSLAEGREMGLDEETNKQRAFLMAGAEGITEAIPVAQFLGKLGKGVVKNIFKGSAAEAGQEALTEALQMGLDAGLYDEDASAKKALETLASWEGLEQMAYAGVVGAGMGATLGAPAAVAADAQARARGEAVEEPGTTDDLVSQIEESQAKAEMEAAEAGGDSLDQAFAGSVAAAREGAQIQAEMEARAADIAEEEFAEAERADEMARQQEQQAAAERYAAQRKGEPATPEEAYTAAEEQVAAQKEAEIQEAEYQREMQAGEQIEAQRETEETRPTLADVAPAEITEPTPAEPAEITKPEPAQIPDLRPTTVVVDAAGQATEPLTGSQMDLQIRKQYAKQTDVDTTKGERLREIPVKVQGIDVLIENPKGSTRSGTRKDGTTWSVKFKGSHYGKMKGVRGADNESLDVFLGSQNPQSDKVWVIDQIDQTSGAFDEHKVMLGFDNQLQAVKAYKQNHEAGWKVGPVTQMTMEEFKAWTAQPGIKNQAMSITPEVVSGEADVQAIAERQQRKGRKKPKVLFALPDGMKLQTTEEMDPVLGTGEMSVELTDQAGTVRGGISADIYPESKEIRIATSELDESLHGQKIGLEMYNHLLKEAADRGFDITSDRSVSGAAVRVYEALERRGATVIRNPNARDNGRGDGGLVTDDIRNPVFTIKPTTIRLKQGDVEGAAAPEYADYDEVVDAVSNAVSYMPGLGTMGEDVVVVKDYRDLPEDLTNHLFFSGQSDAKGLYDATDDVAYVITDNVSGFEEAMQVFLHEAVAHKGLRAVFGDDMKSIMADIWARGNQNAIRALGERYGFDMDTAEGQESAAEEYVAQQAEKTDPPTMVRRVMDAIRSFLRELGVLQNWTDNDIRALIREVKRGLRRPTEQRAAVEGGISLAKGPSEQDIADKISSVPLLEGTETLEIPGAKRTKAGKLKADTKTLAAALVARTKKANRGRALDSQTPRTKEIVARALADETVAAMQRSGHAGNWYSTVLHNAVNIAAEIHPELKTDSNARAAFMLGLSLTSNGLDVATNSAAAEQVYSGFKRTGKFPERGYGDKGPAMKQGFEQANILIEKWGLNDFVRFLNTEFTVGELNQLGFDVSGEGVDHVTHGSVIFGPKIGGGFYQNLMGNYAPITIDRWFMRTWGRLTGTLLPDSRELPATQAERFAREVEKDRKKIVELGFNPDEVLANDSTMLEAAIAVHNEYKRSGFKDKTELNKAGKNLDIAMRDPIIAPRSGGERAWIREVTARALDILAERNLDVNAASMQALVWYPEKDLYLQYGVGNAKSQPTDFEQEFAKLAADRGIDQSRIDAARTGDTGERLSGDVGPGGPEAGGVEGTAPETFGRQERQHLLQRTVTRRNREQLSRPYKEGSDRGKLPVLDGVKAKKVYKPAVQTRNSFKRVGMATPDFMELPATPEAAAVFHTKITEAKVASPAGAAVYVYDQAEYENMRLFVDPTGKVGFALNGDDIVSVFKFPDKEMPNAAQAAMGLAVAEGGRRLDAFDTVLPSIYSLQGFKVISRMKWDPDQAPPDWSKKQFARWNDGEPDVVFMAYDAAHFEPYTGQSEGVLTDDYGNAVELQMRAVGANNEGNKKTVMLSLPPANEDRVNSDPESPLARLTKIGATVEMQAKQGAPSVTRNMLAQFRDRGVIKTTLALVPRRNLADFLPEQYAPSLKRYLREANRMTGRRNELMHEAEEVARKWSTWTRGNKREAGRLGDLMHASTLAGIDPSKKYAPLKKPKNMTDADKKADALRREQYIMLKDAYDRMDSTAKEIYNEVRDSYIQMRKDLEAGLEARIEASEGDKKTKAALMDKLRQQFERGRVAGPYFPLMRYGDRWAVAKDADGEVLSYSRFENREDQRAWVKEFKDAGYAVTQGKKSESDRGTLSQVDPDFVRRVTELTKGDPALQDEIWQMYLNSLPELSMRKRFLHRKGRLGFAADALRSYANVSFRAAHQQAKLEHMHIMQDHLRNLRSEAEAIENNPALDREFEWAMPTYDEVNRRHEAAQNPNASAWSVALTGFGFQWFLGWTPAAAAVNFTQTPLVALPVLAAKFGTIGAFKELSVAVKQTARTRKGIENSLRGDERRAFDEANRIGLFEKTQAHDLAGVTEMGMENYGSAWQEFSRIGAFMFHNVEQLNRRASFLAGYRLARKQGMTHDDAVLTAEDLTWDSHFDYNNDNRPVWMQNNWARVITLFKQYSLNMTYRMARDFNDSIRGYSPQQKKEARKRFAGVMLMAWTMSGFSGLPAIASQLVPWVIEALFSDDDDPFDAEDAMRAYLADQYGSKAAEAIMKGPVDAFTPATLSSRVSLSQLWWRDPSPTDTDEAAATKMIMDILGPIPSTAIDMFVLAPQLINEGYQDRGLEKATPKALRDLLRAYRYSTEGAQTMHKPSDTLVSAEDFTMGDVVAQAVGFTPSRLTMQYEQNAALRGASKALQDRRAQLLDRYVMAISMSDKQEAREAWDAIQRWNTKQPTLEIDSDTLQSSIGRRYTRSAKSRGGVTLPDDMYFLYKDLMFTPLETLTPSKGNEEEDEND